MARGVYTGGYPDWMDRSQYKSSNLLKNPMTYMALLEGFLRGRNEAKAQKLEQERYDQARADRLAERQEAIDWRNSQATAEAQRQAAIDARNEDEYKRRYVGWTDYGGADWDTVKMPELSMPDLSAPPAQDWKLDTGGYTEGQMGSAQFKPDLFHPPTEYRAPKPNRKVVTSGGGIYLVDEDTGKIISSKEPVKKPVFSGGVPKKKAESPEKSIAKAYEEINSHAGTLMKQAGDGTLPTATVNRILQENGIADIGDATYEMYQKEARHYLNPFASKVLKDYEAEPAVPPEIAKTLIDRLNKRLPPEQPENGGGGGGGSVGEGNVVYLGEHMNQRTGQTDHLYRDTATGKTFRGAPPAKAPDVKMPFAGIQVPVNEQNTSPELVRSLRDYSRS